MSPQNAVDPHALARRYVAALDAQPAKGAIASARMGFTEQLHAAALPAPSATRRSLFLFPVIAVLSLVAWLAWPERPITVAKRGQTAPESGVVATAAEPETLEFSDGSEVGVEPNSLVRVQQLTAQGATLALERGRARVSVVHRTARTRWLLMAGPYRVSVVGTRFELQWDPRAGGMSLWMDEGTVEVDGPGLVKQRVTSAQRLEAVADPPRASLFLGPPPAEPLEHREAPLPSPAPSALVTPSKGDRGSERAPARGPTWRYLANAGDAAGALAIAEETGFGRLTTSLPKGDVLLLGDTALRARRPARAKEAWLAVRERFTGTAAAAEAAIRLGSLAFESEHDPQAGALFFERAIKEAPNGPSAPAALGKWMELVAKSGNRDDAHALARDYLKRYPNGAQVELARQLLNERREGP